MPNRLPRSPRNALLLLAVLALPAAALADVDGDGRQAPPGSGAPLALGVPLPPSAPPGQDQRGAVAAAPSLWSAAFQSTYVWQRKPSFAAAYSGPKSLTTSAENGYTLTATFFLGARVWPGGELFVNPEVTQSEELSHLSGLAGLSNGEAQKSGGPEPKLYRARAFLRQTVALGGEESAVEAGPNQVAGTVASRRLVVTAGNFSFADVFDPNAFAHDPRTQFLNWTLMAYGASDYAADVRGYTWGIALEYYLDDWAFRAGRFAVPRESNGLALDANVLAHHGDAVEIEHAHALLGQPGKVRVLGIRNEERMGAFRDALRYAAANGGAPDVANVRRDQAKYGLGVGFEQSVTADLGLFGRFSMNDGATETYAFTEAERSLSFGASGKGTPWRRSGDTLGLAWVQNELSSAHRSYVEAQGAGVFIGDGALRYRPERILEAYYSARLFDGFWLSVDAQRIANPAYNADRGPVNIIGCRFHVER